MEQNKQKALNMLMIPVQQFRELQNHVNGMPQHEQRRLFFGYTGWINNNLDMFAGHEAELIRRIIDVINFVMYDLLEKKDTSDIELFIAAYINALEAAMKKVAEEISIAD